MPPSRLPQPALRFQPFEVDVTRRIPPTPRVRQPAPMPAHEALAILIAYATEGAALKRDAVSVRRRARRKRKLASC